MPQQIPHLLLSTQNTDTNSLLSPSSFTFMAQCPESPTAAAAWCAYQLLFQAAMAVPTWHYLLAMALILAVFLYNFLEIHFLEDLFSGFRGGPISLTYNPCSEIYHQVAFNCQMLHGRYLATPWLCSPHIQTTFINFFGRPPMFRYRREMFHASDGGTLALDWLTSSDVSGDLTHRSHPISKDDTTPLVVLIPGLTSDSGSPYLQQLAFCTAKRGWNVVIINHRGLGGVPVTSDCFYNAGWTEDVRDVNDYLHNKYPKAPLFVIGTSIGANILVKYLGEHGENVPVAGAVAVCNTWDLLIGSRFIARRLVQKLYDRALTIGLQGYAELHQSRYSQLADWEGIRKSRSIRDFDTYATCLVGKYETVDTYYRRCSSSPYVACVAVPLLCIGALDDPVCTKEAVPWDECRTNKNVVLAMTQHGGHLAFFEGIRASSLWWTRAANEFLGVLHCSHLMHKQKKTPMDSIHPTMQSQIDHAPYISASNGMVAAMGNEQATNDADEQSSGKLDSQCQTSEANQDTEFLSFEAEAAQSSTEAGKSGRTSGFNATNIKRWLNQLSEQNKRSTWLLVYIATLATCPLLGAALNFFFAKKVRKALPARSKIETQM